jgi:hypothetical protein
VEPIPPFSIISPSNPHFGVWIGESALHHFPLTLKAIQHRRSKPSPALSFSDLLILPARDEIILVSAIPTLGRTS